MKWEYRITADDYLAARRLSRRPRRLLRSLLVVGAVMMALVSAVQIREAYRTTGVFPRQYWILLAAAAYIAFILYYMLPRLIRKAFDQNKALQAPITLELAQGGIAINTGRDKFEGKLKDIRGWRVNATVAILYHARGEFFILPLRVLGEADRARFLKDMTAAMGNPGR